MVQLKRHEKSGCRNSKMTFREHRFGLYYNFAIEQFFALGDLRDIVAPNSTHLIIKNQIFSNPNSYQSTNRFRSGMVAATFSTCLPCTS